MTVTRLSPADASAHMLAGLRPLDADWVPLLESPGRVLARDVVSPVALPPWSNASMDGYAVRAVDVRGATPNAPVKLAVVGTVQAGGRARVAAVTAGQAVRIMTGAPVPPGADGVVRVEDTVPGDGFVHVMADRDAGRNVRERGEDLQAGALAVAAGTPLGAAHVGVLASCGATHVEVHRRPRIAILATGDELVTVERFSEVVAGDRIVSSNSYALQAAVHDAGGHAVPLGIAPDDRRGIADALRRSQGCDLLLTTGGVSVGDFDFTREVVTRLGGALSMWRVLMRPGAPLAFGTLFGAPWIGLPGNPVSALVTFELFARPMIRLLAGHRRPHRRTIPVVLAEDLGITAPLTHYLRVVLAEQTDGSLAARLTGAQSSGVLSSMTAANALLIVPPDTAELSAGSRLRAIPLGDDWGHAGQFPA